MDLDSAMSHLVAAMTNISIFFAILKLDINIGVV